MSEHEDIISQMPDDILIHIISHLNVREAAATSILTPRWRYLSTYTTRLYFPRPFETKYITYEDIDQDLIRSFPHYINTINRVLDLHRGIRIKEFKVYTYTLKGATMDKWFEFALAKDVEILHIHMEIGGSRTYVGHYPLRENLNLMGETLSCLKELSLLCIDMNDGDIQLLLNKFPLLESLSITRADSLRHVSIVGHSSSKLKHLELSDNLELIEIEIDNFVNLVSFWCLEIVFSLKIKNVPKLIEFSMCDDEDNNCTYTHTLSEMSSSIYHQLQTLKIFIDPFYYNEVYKQRMPLQLNGLKNLELCVDDFKETDNMSYNPMYIIPACPSLEKLEIKFSWKNPSLIEVNEDCEEYIDMVWCTKKVCFNILKKMKISGFIGSLSELKFIFSILKNVNTVEELVVETCDLSSKVTRNLVREHAQIYFGLTALKVVVI